MYMTVPWIPVREGCKVDDDASSKEADVKGKLQTVSGRLVGWTRSARDVSKPSIHMGAKSYRIDLP
jgi:hypothetical protein